jgi:hypothetical protein
MAESYYKMPDGGQSPIHAVPVNDGQQQMVFQTVDQNGNVVYMTGNPGMMPQQQGSVMYAVQQPNGTVAYVQQPGMNPTTVIITANETPAAKDPQLKQFIKNYHGAYAILLLVEGIFGSVLAHYGSGLGIGVALPCFLGMVLGFLSLAAGNGYCSFLGSNIIQFVFLIISISCASAAYSQNFTLEACAKETDDFSGQYTTYGHASYFQQAIDCSSGYIFSDDSCACVNHVDVPSCLHFTAGYNDCDALLNNVPALSLVVFILALVQLFSLIAMFFHLVVVVDRSKL